MSKLLSLERVSRKSYSYGLTLLGGVALSRTYMELQHYLAKRAAINEDDDVINLEVSEGIPSSFALAQLTNNFKETFSTYYSDLLKRHSPLSANKFNERMIEFATTRKKSKSVDNEYWFLPSSTDDEDDDDDY